MTDAIALRAARIDAGLSQAALAADAGLSRSAISMMEGGNLPVSADVWHALGLDGPPPDPTPAPRARARASSGNRVQVVLSDRAAAIWRRWVDEGGEPASDRVSRLIEEADDATS